MANFGALLDKMCKSYAGDNGKMLLHLGALGWILSSAAHIFMIATSKTIDKEKKKYLLPQETLDGAVNVGMYYTITDLMKKVADWTVENKRMPDSTIKAMEAYIEHTGRVGTTDAFIKEVGQSGKKGLFGTLKNKGASNFYKKAITELTEGAENPELLQTLKNAQGEFRKFKNGVGTAASIATSVVVVSILAPILRNKLTNELQKRNLKREAPEDPKVFYNTARPLPLVFKSVAGDRLKI